MKKSKIKYNVVDFIIVIVLVVAILTVIGFVMNSYYNKTNDVKINYVLEIDEISTDYSPYINAGEKLYSYDDKTYLGNVIAVSSSPLFYVGHDKEGNEVQTQITDNVKLYVTVESDAVQTKDGYKISGNTILVNNTYDIISQNLYFNSKCISIQTVPNT